MYAVVVLGLLLSLSVVECSTSCNHTSPCKFVGGQPLKQPSQHVSKDGKLEMEYRVRIVDFQVEWLTLYRRTYDGEIPSATWRIKQGDQVHLHLINTLTYPDKQQPPNGFRYPNSTNIHVHGLHISSEEPQDNVFVQIKPGHSYHYFYEIDPQNPGGTYWYHSHLHGASMFQVQGGMAGMIIVEDVCDETPAHLWAVSCPDNCQHDIQLVFQPTLEYMSQNSFATIQNLIQDDPLFRHSGINVTSGGTLEDWLVANINLYTTNGQVEPMLTIATGQTKRFRMVNAGGTFFLALMIYKERAQVTDGCNVLEIAHDGVYLDKGAFPKSNRSLIVPSGRVDWLVVCNKPGNYEVRSLFFESDTMSMGDAQLYNNQILLKINVVGEPTRVELETSLPKRPHFVGDFTKLPQSDIHGRFVVEAGPGFHLNRERFSNHTHYRYNSRVGEMQEWYIINTDPFSTHPIHIHVNHFQVISYNKYSGTYASGSFPSNDLVFFSKEGKKCFYQHAGFTGKEMLPTNNSPPLTFLGHDERFKRNNGSDIGYSDIGAFQDTLLVQPLANITVRFLAHKYTGEVVSHCHLLAHEDLGMLMVTYIDHAGSNIEAVTPSGNAYPGTCNKTDVFPFNKSPSCSTASFPNSHYSYDEILNINDDVNKLDDLLNREDFISFLHP